MLCKTVLRSYDSLQNHLIVWASSEQQYYGVVAWSSRFVMKRSGEESADLQDSQDAHPEFGEGRQRRRERQRKEQPF